MSSLKTLRDVVDWGLCIGCGACAFACDKGAVGMVHVEAEGFRPRFRDGGCQECADCLEFCPGARVDGDLLCGSQKTNEADHEFGPALDIYEGWASDAKTRFSGSSGGVLSALSLYCLEQGGFAGVIHVGMDPDRPWMNRNVVSRTRDDILARTGSRYAPSAPCAALEEARDTPGPHVFIGKPCDTAAVGALMRQNIGPQVNVGLLLTFFCAGTPSTQGTLTLLDRLGVDKTTVKGLHYRGQGWPGHFRIVGADAASVNQLSYRESWSQLTSYRPLRCNLCPDGLGRVADISCGDAWQEFRDDGDPGRSLVLVRTERGRAILAGAVSAGYVRLRRATSDDVLRAQPSLLERRRVLFGRLAAFWLLGAPVPNYKGFSLFRSWARLNLVLQVRSFGGTLRRVWQRRWYKRRPFIHDERAGGHGLP
jgi:coenzyme F420 hydrogenase subunit beta